MLTAEKIDLGDGLLAAVQTLLARTPCRLVLVQADDLAGEETGVNLPGTDWERPNWRRRLGVDVAELGRKARALPWTRKGPRGPLTPLFK